MQTDELAEWRRETLEQFAERITKDVRKSFIGNGDDEMIAGIRESHMVFAKACVMQAIGQAMCEGSPAAVTGTADDDARGREAWELLCRRLHRDPATSEESDTCSLRAAWKAMLAFGQKQAPSAHKLDETGLNCSCHARFSTRWEATAHATESHDAEG